MGTAGPRVVNSHASAPGDERRGEGQPYRHADQQGIHDRAEIHRLLDRRRKPPRQDVHQSAGGRQGGAHGHRPRRQSHAAGRASTSASCRARRPAWKSSTRRRAPGATSASARSSSPTASRQGPPRVTTSARWRWPSWSRRQAIGHRCGGRRPRQAAGSRLPRCGRRPGRDRPPAASWLGCSAAR